MKATRKKLLFYDVLIGFGTLLIYPILLHLSFSQQLSGKVLSSISEASLVKSQLGISVLWYLLAVFISHMVAFLTVWWLTCVFLEKIRNERSFILSGVCIMCVFALWCYIANASYFPNSQSASVVNFFLKWEYSQFSFILFNILVGLYIFISLWRTVKNLNPAELLRRIKATRFSVAGAVTGGIIVLLVVILPVRGIFANLHNFTKAPKNGSLQAEKPDIILLGIDSLRPDFLDAGESIVEIPNIRGFVDDSLQFKTAYTPLARTYPAWNAILTGAYPGNNGAVFNLIDNGYRNTEMTTLATRLKNAGYETVYATDEKRFSNIDESFGFDRILGPPMGAADFLLGTINDFPLSNLIVNTPFGRILFPYSYGNRAASVTYEPDTFLSLIKNDLENNDEQPSLLCIHLCLCHWPYKWRKSYTPIIPNTNNTDELRYLQSLEAVDRQFGQLLTILKNKGYFENAVVVLLSDHGEGLSTDNNQIDASDGSRRSLFGATVGHGTDILNRKQYEVVLAYRGVGEREMATGVSMQTAGLIDIAPTLLDLVDLSPEKPKQFDGISLRPWLEDADLKPYSRYFFVETGLSIPSILSATPNMAKAISEGYTHYQVLSNGRVVIKDESIALFVSQKQYAVYFEDLSFVRIPNKKGNDYREVFVNNKSAEYFEADRFKEKDLVGMKIALNEYLEETE